jgi:hypothetical protein
MKRIAFALLIGLTLFGAVWGLANTLGVNATVLQAGDDTVDQCDTDGVGVNYVLVYGGAPAGWRVDKVDVTGIDCPTGTHLYVILTDGTGAAIGHSSPQPPTGSPISGPGTANRDISEDPLVEDVKDVHVLLQG